MSQRIRVLSAACLAILGLAGCGEGPAPAAGAPYARTAGARGDSALVVVNPDADGDTLTIRLGRYLFPNSEHIRVAGPFARTEGAGTVRLWGMHRLVVNRAGAPFSLREDLCTQGKNSILDGFSEGPVDSAEWGLTTHETWRLRTVGASRDTFDIARRVTARAGEPYFLIEYEMVFRGQEPGDFWFCWYSMPRLTPGGSMHDVGHAPGRGPVYRRTAVRAALSGHAAVMMNVGNPEAPYADTTRTGAPSHMSRDIMVPLGGGSLSFAAAFVAFNPAADIVPLEFAWADTAPRYIRSLDRGDFASLGDSALAGYAVYDGPERYFLARTGEVVLTPGRPVRLEYAIGRCRVGADAVEPALPGVNYSIDGNRPSRGQPSN